MLIPAMLQHALDVARLAMLEDPGHNVNLGYRHGVWAALGSSSPRIGPSGSPGYKRRTILAILCAKHVLPIWESVWPRDRTPHSILIEAEAVLRGEVDPALAWDDRDRYWDQIGELTTSDPKVQAVVAVGDSAIGALTVALRDEIFDPGHIDLNLSESDIDCYDSDAALWAAAAYAGGGIWEESSDDNKRREFYDWWLEQVPLVWSSVPD